MTGRPRRQHAHQVLFVVLLAALATAALRQLADIGRAPHALGLAVTLAYLGWVLAEARITFRDAPADAPPDPTLPAYATARTATAVAGVLAGTPWTAWSWWLALPVLLFAGGVAFRLWAIRSLGRFYSHRVLAHEGQHVVTDGPYRVVRHPAYTGMLAAHAGFVAYFLNPWSLAAYALLVAAIVWRIGREERMLTGLPGYRSYALHTARLVPKVW
ncbi:Protein-S-isoprenylcysteine O-methyltransferase Ste14 [Micromonospora chaiyaphumensis]|uniref:Protein-S-isoprenylcysteine O-methyltransferase Ste14 n=1 Tax=Micromonospora chaiyaphumensis TaxID=307119 RepID=A0A1C4W161_9ACTN|nr:Protein-S-isoprenylcysteine O-methyltransferase Ste14 [Micromonospora chaiyaphumensis]